MKKSLIIGTVILSLLLAGGCAKKKLDLPAAQSAAPAAEQVAIETIPAEIPARASEVTEPVSDESPALAGLETVYFEYDSYTLSLQNQEILKRNAQLLKAKPAVKITIEGHCDERGSDLYNLALGEKRAQAVLNYLVALGLPADRFAVISYGEEKPAVPGHSEEAWVKNRRVSFM